MFLIRAPVVAMNQWVYPGLLLASAFVLFVAAVQLQTTSNHTTVSRYSFLHARQRQKPGFSEYLPHSPMN